MLKPIYIYIEKLQDTMNSELDKILLWFKVNKLSLNVLKTNYMLFRGKANVNELNIKIDNNGIKKVSCTKLVGTFIDETLSWLTQIQNIENKVSRGIGVLYTARGNLHDNITYALPNPSIAIFN